MKIIIAGSRDGVTEFEVSCAVEDSGWWGQVTEVVSGCGGRVDAAGERMAARLGVPVSRFPADWAKHGRAAGPIRNRQMAAYADALVLVHRGTAGSLDMKRAAEAKGLRIHEVVIRRAP